jgi:hypothetical protein
MPVLAPVSYGVIRRREERRQGGQLNRITQVRIEKLTANVVGSLVVILLSLAMVLIARQQPGYTLIQPAHILGLLAGLVVLSVVHEALHAFALISVARVPATAFRFGVVWHALMPFCHCTIPVRLSHYRFGSLLPLFVTGILALALMLEYPSDGMAAFAGITMGVCAGDVWMVWRLRRFPGDFLAIDHPAEIGCDVMPADVAARAETA